MKEREAVANAQIKVPRLETAEDSSVAATKAEESSVVPTQGNERAKGCEAEVKSSLQKPLDLKKPLKPRIFENGIDSLLELLVFRKERRALTLLYFASYSRPRGSVGQ